MQHREKTKKSPVQPVAESTLVQQLSIKLVGELDSRRTFADAQFIEDEKEMEKYQRRQEKSNPVLVGPVNENIRKRFEEMGIVKANELLLHQFKYSTNETVLLKDNSGKTYNLQFTIKIPGSFYGIMKMQSGKDSCEIKFPYRYPEGLKYALMDIIPGGMREIVVLSETYIMMGYNFDLLVYEIKSS